MSDGYPAETNQGLFSNLKRAFFKRVKDDKVTEEEIMDMVNEGHESGVLKENEAEMINNILSLVKNRRMIL